MFYMIWFLMCCYPLLLVDSTLPSFKYERTGAAVYTNCGLANVSAMHFFELLALANAFVRLRVLFFESFISPKVDRLLVSMVVLL